MKMPSKEVWQDGFEAMGRDADTNDVEHLLPAAWESVMGENRMQEKWLDEAIRLALENVELGNGGPFGAVIVRGGELVAAGVNQVTRQNDPTAHAEVVAIRNACAALGSFTLTGCTLYASCEPCPMCLAACYWARLDAVYFASTREDAALAGFDDAFLYEELQKSLLERSLPIFHVDHPAAAIVFERWSECSQKTAY